jgi:predicted RNA-binding Zn ribbon-like protein
VTDPTTIVALANARAVKRPTGSRARELHDALADAASASELLAPLLARPVAPRELSALRELQRAVSAIVEALIDGSPAPLEALNSLAARHLAERALEQGPGSVLHVRLRFRRAPAVAILTHQAISEFEGLDSARLRRCSRPECRLVFYDLTRSGTRRWHSEQPCGLRERQRRHRARHASKPADPAGTTQRVRAR